MRRALLALALVPLLAGCSGPPACAELAPVAFLSFDYLGSAAQLQDALRASGWRVETTEDARVFTARLDQEGARFLLRASLSGLDPVGPGGFAVETDAPQAEARSRLDAVALPLAERFDADVQHRPDAQVCG